MSPAPRVLPSESSVPPRSSISTGLDLRSESAPPPPASARRVLVIKRAGPRRDALVEMLCDEGYDVRALAPSDSVVDFVHRTLPDLVLIEVRDGVGIALCRELRSTDAGHITPIVLFATAPCDEATVVWGLQSGADDYVVAPGRVAELKARVSVQLRNLRDREILRWAREQRSSFRDEALTDTLTGLPNRRAVDRALAEALSGDEVTTVMLLDIDHFKLVNDTWGHAVGDEVLRRIAAALHQGTRRGDFVGRLGGEEFVVILRGLLPGAAAVLGDRYRESVGAVTFPPDRGPQRTTVSVGISRSDGMRSRPTPSELLARADEALYEAKRAGRDRVRLSEAPSDGPKRSSQAGEPRRAVVTDSAY